MKWKINILLLVVLSVGFASCEQFLDTLPDNRTQIDTEKKINQLLVSAYPGANYAVLTELSSDNFVDNNAILPVQLSAYERMHDEIFAWEPVTSSTRQDSPSFVWESCYAAIATANQALEAIAELTEQDASLDLSAQKGEALLCRAYSHFILVNIFAQAYKDEERSQVDPGVPYVTQSETIVSADYKRESVQEVYAKIEEDLEAGLALISDHHYTVAKYHFNTKAANAFAARFYLYKRDYQKVVKYADKVLGTNPTNLMRRWDVDYDNIDAIIYDYVSVNQAANFLLLPTSSLFGRIYGKRYGHNYDAMFGSTYGSGPTWSTVLPAFDGKLYISVQQDYGVFFPKASEMFEYTDKVAGIGFTHIVRAEFTAEETLLCRAEALIYLDRINEAVADLQVWNSSHLAPEELTLDVINNFYRPHNILFVKGLRNAKMSNQFKITPEQLPLIHCVLHFRRIETMFDGYRWFDIKRYGIEITHNIDGKGLQQLSFDDERRAIQLPQEVISAGMESNPRTMDAQSSEMYEKFKN